MKKILFVVLFLSSCDDDTAATFCRKCGDQCLSHIQGRIMERCEVDGEKRTCVCGDLIKR